MSTAALGSAGPAEAATFTVTTTSDGPPSSPTTDGACSSTLSGNPCTLRAAIYEASDTSGDDVVTLPAGTYGLDSQLFVFDAKGSLTVNGAGAATTSISSGGTHRMMNALRVGHLTFNGVTVENGGQIDRGAAIFLDGGNLTFNDSVVRNNKANDATKNVAGGAMFVFKGDATFNRTTFTGNQAAASASFSAGGGAIGMNGAGTLTIANSTLTSNFARRSSGSAFGGALSVAGSKITILNSTFADNSAPSNNSTIQVTNPTPFTIKNSIFASPSPTPAGSQCSAGINLSPDSTGNIDTESTCVPPGGNQVNTDPKLGPFGSHGGPTPTFQPAAGSPALNKVSCAGLLTDQRGFPRPAGSTCDVGSVETSTDLGPAVTAAPTGPVPIGAPFTVGLTVTNAGPDSSSLGTMTFTPSAGTTVQAATSTGGCSVGATTICGVGGLARGASTPVSLTLVAASAGQAGGTAATTSAPEDLNAANDAAAVSVFAQGPAPAPIGSSTPTPTPTPTPAPAPAPAPKADTTSPLISGLVVSPPRLRAAASGPSVAAGRAGGKVSYVLSEAGSVRFGVERVLTGRRVGGRCLKPMRSQLRASRCTRYSRLTGGFTHRGGVGRNSFRFTGRLNGRKLVPGRFRLRARATDAAGNASRLTRVRFSIVRR